jgi:hypothetical protein
VNAVGPDKRVEVCVTAPAMRICDMFCNNDEELERESGERHRNNSRSDLEKRRTGEKKPRNVLTSR